MSQDLLLKVGAITQFKIGGNRVVTDTTSQFPEQAVMDESPNPVEIAGLILDPSTSEASLDGQPLKLTKTEFRLLLFLMRSDGRGFTRREIIAAVQGDDYPATEQSIDNHVMLLRRKLGSRARLIETVRGVGYRRRTHS